MKKLISMFAIFIFAIFLSGCSSISFKQGGLIKNNNKPNIPQVVKNNNTKINDDNKVLIFSKDGLEISYPNNFKVDDLCVSQNKDFKTIFSINDEKLNKSICLSTVDDNTFSNFVKLTTETGNELEIDGLQFKEISTAGIVKDCMYYAKNNNNGYYFISFMNNPNYMDGTKCFKDIDKELLSVIKVLNISK